jgi:hypothetical protein
VPDLIEGQIPAIGTPDYAFEGQQKRREFAGLEFEEPSQDVPPAIVFITKSTGVFCLGE